MQNIDQLSEQFPDAAQTWGIALATAYAARNEKLSKAVLADAQAAGVDATYLEDAKAAAILMGMNNVYYRFRHIIGKEEYEQKPARLRMMRLKQVATNQVDFELLC